jgi:hypothetical protein
MERSLKPGVHQRRCVLQILMLSLNLKSGSIADRSPVVLWCALSFSKNDRSFSDVI